MTNNERHFRSEDPPEELASDVWGVAKSLTPMSAEEELEAWEQAVAALHDFGKLAETLHNDPLLLALTDAKDRAEEELERVQDRLARPEGETLHPREHERLMAMIARCDALDAAYWTVSGQDWQNVEKKTSTLAGLQAMREEAHAQFDRYRAECGLED